mmetsp:Transcript_25069/g.54205  ORF Transcript_25069/g.54205 Transcript_25069/m.54205 type:complete len:114 (-) Transcript_25069:285-626(-)
MTGNTGAEEKKLKSFDRVRLIQEEMIRSAKASGWVLIEQRVDPDPLDVVADELFKASACIMQDVLMDELEEDCMLPKNNSGGELKKSIDDLVRAEKEDLEATSLDGSKEEVEI